MKIAAIMQPTYLPWLGYFDLISNSDIFIILDNVQFDKRSWQQRNRIKSPNGELMLTVPVLSSGKFAQKINEVSIDHSQKFKKKHFNSIVNCYKKSHNFEKLIHYFEKIYSKEISSLYELNYSFIKMMSSFFKIKTEFIFASSLQAKGKKSALLVNICKELNIKNYYSPKGSKAYIESENLFKQEKIEVHYQDYNHPIYNQLHGDFIPNLSALDYLFCAKEINIF